MKIRFLYLILGALLTVPAFAQKSDKNLIDKTKIALKLNGAEKEMSIYNYRGALSALRAVASEFPGDAKTNYLTAKCHLELKSYSLAKEYIDKALGKDFAEADLYYTAGRIYHRMADLEAAETNYIKYKSMASNADLERNDVVRNIQEVRFAREQMKNPSTAKMNRLNDYVNSRYEDYSPQISADGDKLYFTSRRSDGLEGGIIDTEGDFGYFEKIFVSEWDEETNDWGNANKVEGKVNNENEYNAILSLGNADEEMLVYINSNKYHGDIFLAKHSKSGRWMTPKRLEKPVNTSYFEGSASFSPDGKYLYFVSERKKDGLGQGDIWKSERLGRNEWSEPVNLGDVVNTPGDEKFVYVHSDGKTIYFASDGHLGLGSYDIYRTTFINGAYTKPVNLGYPINTVNEESTFSLNKEATRLYLAMQNMEGLGERDIYEVDLKSISFFDASITKLNTGVIKGSLKASNGKSLNNARIEFYSESSNVVEKTVQVTNGTYEARLKVGEAYILKMFADGISMQTDRVKLKPGVDNTEALVVKNVVLKVEDVIGDEDDVEPELLDEDE